MGLWTLKPGKRRRLSSTAREELYDRCRGDKDHPDCNLCGEPVLIGDAWDDSHVGAPHALGGNETGVAHRSCNRRDGAEVVTPMVAKAKRGRQKFIGAHQTRYPMRGGRDDKISRGMDGRVKPRTTLTQKHAALMAKRGVQS